MAQPDKKEDQLAAAKLKFIQAMSDAAPSKIIVRRPKSSLAVSMLAGIAAGFSGGSAGRLLIPWPQTAAAVAKYFLNK